MKIMLLDDDSLYLNILDYSLKHLNHEFVKYNDPLKALEHLKRESFDLVISDLAMPLMNGFELLNAVRELSSHLKIIIISFHQDYMTYKSILANKAYAFLPKPVQINKLVLLIEEIAREQQLLFPPQSDYDPIKLKKNDIFKK
jgi:DNA-binding NtrC family response regulator